MSIEINNGLKLVDVTLMTVMLVTVTLPWNMNVNNEKK